MLRLIISILIFLIPTVFYIIRMSIIARSKKSREEKYAYSRKVVNFIAKKSRATVRVIGKENIPDKNGFVMYANHQGKFDALATIYACEKPLSVVIRKDKAWAGMVKTFIKLTDSRTIKLNDLKSVVETFRDIAKDVENGKNYLIFPEGGFENNKNELQTFHTGCLGLLRTAKCPIVPVALYDTYKVYNVNSLKKVSCTVSILKPIGYDEYSGLTKPEIAGLIKSKIQEELDRIKREEIRGE